MLMYEQPFQVGPLLVKRVPSSSVRFRVIHEGYWQGYLYPLHLCINFLDTAGKLIEVRTIHEFKAECQAYKAQSVIGSHTRLTYYEVIDAGSA